MNETSSGSFYASSDEIARAQRRYRTRKLKNNLKKYKKELRNAIVIELGPDLHGVGIQPDALFEVGNLHSDVYQLEDTQGIR